MTDRCPRARGSCRVEGVDAVRGHLGTTAAYYTRYLTQADGEQPGHWTGRQAALLGLSGEVTTEDLQALLEGRDPRSGMLLGSPFMNRVTSSGRLVRAVAGFDATLSAPKSLSVWWTLSGDDGLAECHEVAVRAVVDPSHRPPNASQLPRTTSASMYPGPDHPDSHVQRDAQRHERALRSGRVRRRLSATHDET